LAPRGAASDASCSEVGGFCTLVQFDAFPLQADDDLRSASWKIAPSYSAMMLRFSWTSAAFHR
jgi:hypothetical protein